MITEQVVSSAVIPRVATIGALHATQAEPYPERPIKIIVPTPAGGPVDAIARLVGNYLSATPGQAAVIDNRLGAGNIIARRKRRRPSRRTYAPVLERERARARAVIDNLNAQINRGVKSPNVIAALAKLSNEPLGGTPHASTALIKADIAAWTPIVKALGLNAQ